MANANKNRKDNVDRQRSTSLAAINKMVGSIARSATKLNESIHNAGVMIIQHAKDYGDCSPAARLVDALPKSHRRSLVINWFLAFSPITVGKDTKTGDMKAHLKGKEAEREWNIDGAKATPFFAMPEAEREPDVPSYEAIHENVVTYLDRTAKRAEKIENDNEKRKALDEIEAAKKAVGVKAA